MFPRPKRRGRPAKYGPHLGKVSEQASRYRDQTRPYDVNLYGRTRQVMAFDRMVMLKTIKRSVRVVWIFRKTRWIALFSTDLSLSVEHLNLCMMATSVIWIYAMQLDKTPKRRHAVNSRTCYAF